MKGKKITSVSPMEGALSFLSVLPIMANPKKGRVFNDTIGDITVDTCVTSDTGVWETGIKRDSVEGKWVIVSQYETDEEAQKGHGGWVALVTKNPTCKLKDIDTWNLEEGVK